MHVYTYEEDSTSVEKQYKVIKFEPIYKALGDG